MKLKYIQKRRVCKLFFFKVTLIQTNVNIPCQQGPFIFDIFQFEFLEEISNSKLKKKIFSI